mmetsp:Transcript_102003/g.233624  ORF Transcript_102003/g.233624 Transcript_102003/m.233624 type:complete len:208 (-) Transcript_102003:464-1087(-)
MVISADLTSLSWHCSSSSSSPRNCAFRCCCAAKLAARSVGSSSNAPVGVSSRRAIIARPDPTTLSIFRPPVRSCHSRRLLKSKAQARPSSAQATSRAELQASATTGPARLNSRVGEVQKEAPQTQTEPLADRQADSVLSLEHSTFLTSSSPSTNLGVGATPPHWPALLSPQQYTWPPRVTARLCLSPAAIPSIVAIPTLCGGETVSH